MVEEVAGLSAVEHSLKTLKNTLNKDQMMFYHTLEAFKDSKRKFHPIIWKLLIRLL